MNLVPGMYENVHRSERVGEGLSDKFEEKVVVHQGSVLSPQPFIVVLCHSRWEGPSCLPLQGNG